MTIGFSGQEIGQPCLYIQRYSDDIYVYYSRVSIRFHSSWRSFHSLGCISASLCRSYPGHSSVFTRPSFKS